eukprot:2097861-Rhodomonas_salina.1
MSDTDLVCGAAGLCTCQMMPGVWYNRPCDVRAELPYGATRTARTPVLEGKDPLFLVFDFALLRLRYAISRTNAGYAGSTSPSVLRLSSAMSGADSRSCAIVLRPSPEISGTDVGYAGTRRSELCICAHAGYQGCCEAHFAGQ